MKRSKIIHDEFVKMWNDEADASEIAQRFGVSNNYVAHYAYEHRAECPKHETKPPVRKTRINHEEFVKLWNEGVRVEEIASRFGIRRNSASKYAYDHRDECPKRQTKPPIPEKKINHQEFMRLWNAGVIAEEIASRLGLSSTYVYQYAGEHREECFKRHNLQSGKIYDHDEFVRLWNDNVSGKEIASEFNVSISYVYRYASEYRKDCPKRERRRK